MVMRMYGAEKMRALIRHHVDMATWLADQVRRAALKPLCVCICVCVCACVGVGVSLTFVEKGAWPLNKCDCV